MTMITTIHDHGHDHHHEHAPSRRPQALSRRGHAIGFAASDKPLDPDKFFPWVQDLVQKEGPNILRCKGILAFKDDDERFVFQGVHMILDGDHQRPWNKDEKRDSRIIFIGRNLPEEKIRQDSRAASLKTVLFPPRAAGATAPSSEAAMTDTRSDTVSVVDRTRPMAAGGAVVAAHFLGRTAVFVLGEEAMVFAASRRRAAARRRPWRRDPRHGRRWRAHRQRRRRRPRDRDRRTGRDPHARDRCETSLDRSCRAGAGRRRGLVGRQDRLRAGEGAARIRSAVDRRRACLPAERAFGSRSPITTAPRCGSPMRRRPRRKSSNGRARISAPR